MTDWKRQDVLLSVPLNWLPFFPFLSVSASGFDSFLPLRTTRQHRSERWEREREMGERERERERDTFKHLVISNVTSASYTTTTITVFTDR